MCKYEGFISSSECLSLAFDPQRAVSFEKVWKIAPGVGG